MGRWIALLAIVLLAVLSSAGIASAAPKHGHATPDPRSPGSGPRRAT